MDITNVGDCWDYIDSLAVSSRCKKALKIHSTYKQGMPLREFKHSLVAALKIAHKTKLILFGEQVADIGKIGIIELKTHFGLKLYFFISTDELPILEAKTFLEKNGYIVTKR